METEELIKRVEAEINKTPTGELRNLLCDANIVLQHQALNIAAVSKQSEQLIDFFKWLNDYEELKYTEKGIKFYVDEYLKSINCV